MENGDDEEGKGGKEGEEIRERGKGEEKEEKVEVSFFDDGEGIPECRLKLEWRGCCSWGSWRREVE